MRTSSDLIEPEAMALALHDYICGCEDTGHADTLDVERLLDAYDDYAQQLGFSSEPGY